MKCFAAILLLFTSLCANAQFRYDKSKFSSIVQRIVTTLEKTDIVYGPLIGPGGMTPDQWKEFEKLLQVARTDELIAMTDHPKPVVRCYAIRALRYRDYEDIFPIVLKHISDTAIITSRYGCLGHSENVGDFFIGMVATTRYDSSHTILSETELAILDSILLFTPNKLQAVSGALYRARGNKKYYSRIQEMVLRKEHKEACITLATFQQECDPEIIMKSRDDDSYNIYAAILEFPHPAFFPFLAKNYLETIETAKWDYGDRILYEAIASYKNEDALKLFERSLEKNDKSRAYRIEFVFHAIQQHNNGIYDNMLWHLWENENMMSDRTFKRLYKLDAGRILAAIKKTMLYSPDALNEFNPNYSNALIRTILDTLNIADREACLEIIRKNLATSEVSGFEVFADQAAEILDTSFIEPLFIRLETDWNTHTNLRAAKALLRYKDPTINKRIIAAGKRNTNLSKGWGKGDFDELLKLHGIHVRQK